MLSKEDAIAKFIDEYDIEVPQGRVDEEFELLMMNYRRKMMYAQMGGQISMNPFEQKAAAEEASDEIRQAAIHEVKEDLVFKKILAEHDFPVSDEELIDYANNMAQREKTTIEMIKKFFDDDFAMLRDSVRRRKAEDWMAEQINK